MLVHKHVESYHGPLAKNNIVGPKAIIVVIGWAQMNDFSANFVKKFSIITIKSPSAIGNHQL